MKKNITILLLLLFVFKIGAFAQQKYGHINSNEVVKTMPEFKQMTDAVEKQKRDAQAKLQKMYDTYQTKQKELNQYGTSMMEAVREERVKELDTIQRQVTAFQQNASADIQKYQEKLLKPLNDKYLKVVGAVAKENGYTYIFDLASGAVVYSPESTGDISGLVKKKLGIN